MTGHHSHRCSRRIPRSFAVCALVGLSIWLVVLFGLLSGVQAVAWVTERTSAWRLPADHDTGPWAGPTT
ncbi:hypothetical protein [Gordonia amicalis]|uniref:hypothetical protein n=1 Tax=Gordonia amicalis TaxID=89053 RepID=UPI0003472BD9|nr:hypothetical protein [Gordonia amicalis]